MISLSPPAIRLLAKLIGAVATTKPTPQVLECVRLVAADGLLRVEASDGVTSVIVELGADCEGAQLLINAHDFRRLADLVEGDYVHMQPKIDAGQLSWSCGRKRGKIAIAGDEMWPKVGGSIIGDPVTLNASVLADRIDRIRWATVCDRQPHLSGLCVTADEEGMTLKATTGHALAVLHLPTPGCPARGAVMVTDLSLRRVHALLSAMAGDVAVRFDETGLSIAQHNTFDGVPIDIRVHARSKEMLFPSVDVFYEKAASPVFLAAREDVLNATRDVARIVGAGDADKGTRSQSIAVRLGETSITVNAVGLGASKGDAICNVVVDAEVLDRLKQNVNPSTIGAQCHYLQGALRMLNGAQVAVSCRADLGGVIRFDGLGDEGQAIPNAHAFVTQLRLNR